MAYGEDIEYCEDCGGILQSSTYCGICNKLTAEGEQLQQEEDD